MPTIQWGACVRLSVSWRRAAGVNTAAVDQNAASSSGAGGSSGGQVQTRQDAKQALLRMGWCSRAR